MTVTETKHPPHVRQETPTNPHTEVKPPEAHSLAKKEKKMNEKDEVVTLALAKDTLSKGIN